MLYERGCTKALQRYKRAISLFSIGAWYLSSLRERQMFWQSTKLILNIKHRQWFRRPADFLPGPPPPLPLFYTTVFSATFNSTGLCSCSTYRQSSVLFFATNSALNRGNLANAGDKLMSQALCDSDRAFFATIEDCCCREAEDFLIFSISSSSPSLNGIVFEES